jgi:RHS repeat-associated protein
MRRADGTWVNNNRAHYTAYGSYMIKPGANVNPGISDRGYTGHRHNNTGTYDLGLIYMNARYYLPEVGRFISPDTIVPDPSNPQSYNRYSYTRNNPVNLTDPTGHMETDGCHVTDCSLGGLINPATVSIGCKSTKNIGLKSPPNIA